MKTGRSTICCPAEFHRRAATVRANLGFSLIELLVVAAILIILTTMYWGSDSRNRRRAREAACEANLQKIYMAMDIYSKEQRGSFPQNPAARTSEPALSLLVPHYTVSTEVFICPGSKDSPLPEAEPFTHHKISYAYVMGRKATDGREPLLTDRQVNALPKAQGELVFSSTGKPPGNNHENEGGNFLFTDGSVEFTPPRIPFSLVLTQGLVLLNPKP